MPAPRKTLTLNLTDDEMKLLDSLAMRKDATKTAILKAAIKLYYLINLKVENGEKLFTEDNKGIKAELLLL